MIRVNKFKIFFALHCALIILLALWIAHGSAHAQTSRSAQANGKAIPLEDIWPDGPDSHAALMYQLIIRDASCTAAAQTQAGGIGIVLIRPIRRDITLINTCPGSDADPFTNIDEIPPVPRSSISIGNGVIFINAPQIRASIRVNSAYIQAQRSPEDVLTFLINDNGRESVEIQILQ